jgi:glycosyltransferase involved in cell wall biosynthesis
MCLKERKGKLPDSSDEAVISTRKIDRSLRILLCSENVPPQVNGIARRIGHYEEGLVDLGHDVELLHPYDEKKVWPHINPWNFTAKMMIVLPWYFIRLLSQSYDVIHCVLPLNVSGMWLLAAFKILRVVRGETKPALVVSWHCNIADYIDYHAPKFLRYPVHLFFMLLCWILPYISDRVLTPTRSTDPLVRELWNAEGDIVSNAGVCDTGIDTSFHPDAQSSDWGMIWQQRKKEFLKETKCKHLLLCVGRLSPEKGIQDLLEGMSRMKKDYALWLVGDGPTRIEFETLAKKMRVPVKFWGYLTGEALHSVYTAADIFVCPSLTETFGQAVNEALAAEVRVALPGVSVFTEAYGEYIPEDAFWEPKNCQSMVRAIQIQAERHVRKDEVGKPDRSRLKTWEDACVSLVKEYDLAQKSVSRSSQRMKKRVLFMMPFWWSFTIALAAYIYILSVLRCLIGCSFRYFLKTLPNRIRFVWNYGINASKEIA